MWKRFLLLFFVFGLSASCFGASVNWNASIVDAEHGAPDGYRVYYGYAADQLTTTYDVGTELNFTIPETWNPATYYFGVRAYNASGESGWATTPEGQTWVSYVKADPPPVLPPAPATDVQIVWERLMADTTLYTNALAVYDFENNANDTKGAKNLTVSGTPSYSTTGEAQGTYWAGELSGAYFYRSDADFRFSGDYSVSAWVNFTYVTEGYYTIICQCFEGGSEGDGWVVDTDGSRHLRVRHITNFSVTSAIFSGATLSNNTRYHIVVAYSDSGNIVTAWVSTSTFGNIINGTTVAMTANPGTSSAQRLNIGYSTVDSDELYGYIDEVVFWSSAITSTNASAIFGARDGGTSWRETGGGASAVPKIMLLQDHFSGGIH